MPTVSISCPHEHFFIDKEIVESNEVHLMTGNGFYGF